VVEADRGHDRRARNQHVGGVETAAEPDLHDGSVDRGAGEVQKSHHGGELEERELDRRPPQAIADFLGERDHGVL
jgi:hypothetical protein